MKKLVNTIGYEAGWLLFSWKVSDIEGKILTLIETLGLKDTQEKATKDIARDIVQGIYRDGHWVNSRLATDVMLQMQKETAIGQTQPAGNSI